MGNNSSQTKKKKRSSKIHPNFLIIKQEKIKRISFYINFYYLIKTLINKIFFYQI